MRSVAPGALVALATFVCASSIGQAGASPMVTIRMFRSATIAGPAAITFGPDRAVWFTNDRARSVGRISLSGGVIIHRTSAVFAPGAITAGTDGALWFSEGGSTLARMTVRGALAEYPGALAEYPGQVPEPRVGARRDTVVYDRRPVRRSQDDHRRREVVLRFAKASRHLRNCSRSGRSHVGHQLPRRLDRTHRCDWCCHDVHRPLRAVSDGYHRRP